LQRLLDFNWDHDVVFVLPTLLAGSPPRQAVGIEDVHAIEALSKGLVANVARPGLQIEVEFADDLFSLEDPTALRRNLVAVCSPRRNSFTGVVLRHPSTRQLFTCHFGEAQQPKTREHGRFLNIDDQTFWSLDENPNEDYALIAKIPNPWIESLSVVIIAGTRGLGTWGGGELLRTKSDELHTRTNGGNFVAVAKVEAEKSMAVPSLTRYFKMTDGARGGKGGKGYVVGSTSMRRPARKVIADLVVSRPDPQLWGPQPAIPVLEFENDRQRSADGAGQVPTALEGALSLAEVAKLLSIEENGALDLLGAGQLFAVQCESGPVFPYWQFDVTSSPPVVIGQTKDLVEAFPGDELALCEWMERPQADFSFQSPAQAMTAGQVEHVLRVAASLGAAGW